MGLKENTSYNYGAAMKSISKGAANFNKNIPKLNQFSNVRQAVANSSPTTAGTPPSTGTTGGNITTPYGGSTKYEQFHPGVDIANGMGTPLAARASGIVTQVVAGKRQGDPGYGNYVIVTDDQGNKFRYSHLQNTYVKVGQRVNKGQVYGTEGNSGQTYSTSGGTGAHLDFRIQDMYGRYINPNRYL